MRAYFLYLQFWWTLLQSCQVDLIKDQGHQYFIHFLESPDIQSEQRAMAAFVLTVIVDGFPHGQQACIDAGLIAICLSHIQAALILQAAPNAPPSEPLLLQWLCLCLGKLWDGFAEGISRALDLDAPTILGKVLSEPQPEVSANGLSVCVCVCCQTVALYCCWLHNIFGFSWSCVF